VGARKHVHDHEGLNLSDAPGGFQGGGMRGNGDYTDIIFARP
jgi:hypothetical protein